MKGRRDRGAESEPTRPSPKLVSQSRAHGSLSRLSTAHPLMLPRSALSLSRKRIAAQAIDVPVALYSNGIFYYKLLLAPV